MSEERLEKMGEVVRVQSVPLLGPFWVDVFAVIAAWAADIVQRKITDMDKYYDINEYYEADGIYLF